MMTQSELGRENARVRDRDRETEQSETENELESKRKRKRQMCAVRGEERRWKMNRGEESECEKRRESGKEK